MGCGQAWPGLELTGRSPSRSGELLINAQEFRTLAERLKIKVTTTPYPFSQADQALAEPSTALPCCRCERRRRSRGSQTSAPAVAAS